MVVTVIEEDAIDPAVACPIELVDLDENTDIRLSVQGARCLALHLLEAAFVAEQLYVKEYGNDDETIKVVID